MRRLVTAGMLLASLTTAADAKWKAKYINSPRETRDWYQSAELTAAARKRFGFTSCCAHADVVKTRFRVNKIDGDDQWLYLLKDGVTWKVIPNDIIHWGKTGPDGQPVLFINAQRETCFFPGDTGG